MFLKAPKKFKHFLFTFNKKKNHSLKSRLERVKLSNRKFKKSLYPVMVKVKDNDYKKGTYGFVFSEFTMIARWNGNTFHVITLLKSN